MRMRFTKCEDENDLLNHALEWEEYLDQYATHLKADDAKLRTLFLGICLGPWRRNSA